MKTQFRQLYHWPGMGNEIDNLVKACQQCQVHLPSLPKGPLSPTVATSPMEQIDVDTFESAGKHYLCAIYRFSGFPFAAGLKNMTTSAVTRELEKIFMTFGYAGTIRTDNWPAFRSEFGEYCASRGMKHETSSPHFPQSNGHAECGVKICKHLLQKCRNDWNQFESALLEWRNMLRPSGLSPAQLMFGRGQRTTLPKLTSALASIDMDLAKKG